MHLISKTTFPEKDSVNQLPFWKILSTDISSLKEKVDTLERIDAAGKITTRGKEKYPDFEQRFFALKASTVVRITTTKVLTSLAITTSQPTRAAITL